LQVLQYTSGDLAGNNVEQYATWETNDVHQQFEEVAGGNRDGGQVYALGNGSYQFNFPGDFASCATHLGARGLLQGLGVDAKFDGSNIVSQGGAWSKAGYWRLDFVTKVLVLLCLMGVECAFVAVSMPPGMPAMPAMPGLGAHGRMPLKAVFVVDGSSSIEPEMWKHQQKAGEEFVRAFERNYGGHPGDLNVGVVQFASEAVVEQRVTDDMKTALEQLTTMPQLHGGTLYNEGLRACRRSLDIDIRLAAESSFEVCILITDGLDNSMLSTKELQSIVGVDTAVFGIFVGGGKEAVKGEPFLRQLVDCGKAKHAQQSTCDFFASASDYAALSAKADEVTSAITSSVDLATCAMVTALIGLPVGLLMCLPYILWYLSCTSITMYRRRHHESNGYNNLNNSGMNANCADNLPHSRHAQNTPRGGSMRSVPSQSGRSFRVPGSANNTLLNNPGRQSQRDKTLTR